MGIPKLFFLLYSIVAVIPFFKLDNIKKNSCKIGLIISGILFCIILYGGLIGSKRLIVQKETIITDRLPESFNGFRIVQFSDLHLGSIGHNPAFVNNVIQTINKLYPDIIVFTGDLVNSQETEAAPFRSLLSQLNAPYGVYSVLGNHDYGNYHHWNNEQEKRTNFEALTYLQHQAGWTLLNNEHRYLTKKKDSIVIMGVENWGEQHFGRQGDLDKAYTQVNSELFSVLLSHNPVHWQAQVVQKTPIDLTLSGHTHAMQLQIGNYSPSALIYPHWGGIYQNKKQYLNVNRGIGFVLIPFRLGAYPEITLIELRNK